MKSFVVGFEKHNGKQGKRTVRARTAEEAIAKCVKRVENSFWHWIVEVN